jgi:hypothetical protein
MRLVDVIPEVLLRLEPNLDKDIQPRRRIPLAEAENAAPAQN